MGKVKMRFYRKQGLGEGSGEVSVLGVQSLFFLLKKIRFVP